MKLKSLHTAMRATPCKVLFSILLLLFFCTPRFAQAQQVPGSLVPGRQQEKNLIPAPPAGPPSATPLVPMPGQQLPPANSQNIQFILNDIILEDATAIPADELQKLWQEKLHKNISLADLYTITNDITRKYAESGYALSFAIVPEQKINNGIVRIRVIEGFVDKIAFVHDATTEKNLHLFDSTKTESALAPLLGKITQSRPLRTDDLERYLLLANQYPGATAKATFLASDTTPNASTMVVQVTYKPIDASLTTDNRLARSLEHWSATATASINGGLTGKDSLQIGQGCGLTCNLYTTRSIGWTNYIGTNGLKIAMNAALSSETPSNGPLEPLDFSGGNIQWGFDVDYPIIRSRSENLDVGASFTLANNKTKTFAGTLTQDHVRKVDISGDYSLILADNSFNLVHLSITQGLPILAQTEDSDANKSRSNGSAVFTNVNIQAARTQAILPSIPELRGTSGYMALQGQIAVTDPLLSSSQCFYGGADIGRGYDSGALSADHCLMGTIELRHDWYQNTLGAQVYAFGDAAYLRRKGDLSLSETRSLGAQSVGGGVRMSKQSSMQADLQMALPIRESATGNGKSTPRFFLKFSANY